MRWYIEVRLMCIPDKPTEKFNEWALRDQIFDIENEKQLKASHFNKLLQVFKLRLQKEV